MAKNNNPPPSGRSRVRLFFVDADLAPGEIRDLTAAFANAVRPAPQSVSGPRDRQRLGAGVGAEVDGDGQVEDAELEEIDEEEGGDGDDEQLEAQKGSPRRRSPRKVSTVDTLDMNAGGKPFKEFAQEKGNPEEQTARFLVATYWLGEYAKITEVSVDHIYTCYKFAGWVFKLSDPGLLFRHFKKGGLGSTKKGLFTINQIGRARIEEMTAGKES